MLRLSLSTFAERWQLFIGAIVTVCIGVALVQSSLLILISVATTEEPRGLSALEQAQGADQQSAALSLMGITLGVAVFLAAFIVSSTFAFTVAQRRTDLALLRLVGSARGQIRRLLLSEALLLGLIGTGLGIPLGLFVMRVQTWLLTTLGFLNEGFTAQWQDWILGVSAGVGVGIALGGVFAASRRAARVRPLDALRETGDAERVMTFGRWFFGLLFISGAVAMTIVSQFAAPSGVVALMINAVMAASIGLSALSPLIVPLVARVFGVVLRGSTLGNLAEANLRNGVRRSASTAAPLLVLVALVAGQLGATSSIVSASKQGEARDTAGELVVKSEEPVGDDITNVDGVESVSQESMVPGTVTTTEDDGDGDVDTETAYTTSLAVNPADYQQTHVRPVESGSLDELRGNTAAIGPNGEGTDGLDLGSTVHMRVGEQELALRIVAILPPSMGGGPDFLLPPEAAPPEALATAQQQTFVHVRPDADVRAVADDLRASGVGEVSTVESWIEQNSAAQQDTQTGISIVVMGLAGLYAIIAVINAVVIAAAERRSEFAAARLTGLTRWQVVRMALIESVAVTTIGIFLGVAVAVGTLTGLSSALGRITGVSTMDIPLDVVGAIILGACTIIGVTSLWTSLSATKRAPAMLAGSRE